LCHAINSGDAKQPLSNSSVITDGLQQIVNHVDIAHSIVIPNVETFPVEDFFKTPFTHQIEIFTRVSELDKRYYFSSDSLSKSSKVLVSPLQEISFATFLRAFHHSLNPFAGRRFRVKEYASFHLHQPFKTGQRISGRTLKI
jgi:hypothetical protein